MMKDSKRIYFYAVIIFTLIQSKAQVTGCGSNVPFFQVNLVGQPSGIWYSPSHLRQGNCCGTQSPDRCTSFEILLDSNAAMINFDIASGAIPTGAMFYQINCGPQIPVGQPICVTGPGPHYLTFCKPGNNQNTYMVQSIPKPLIPSPQHVRLDCSKKLKVFGLDSSTVTWNSIYPGASGQYNNFLSCTSGCTEPVYTSSSQAPPFVDYKVCGIPIATTCGYVAMCDTVRIYNVDPISVDYSPNPAEFCAGSSGITITANASGGYGSYSFSWMNQGNLTLSNTNQVSTNTAGSFILEVKDALYDNASCPSFTMNISVSEVLMPLADAGPDQYLCYENQSITLSGSIFNASGGVWSGGNGVFIPNNHSLNPVYYPTPEEIASGSVILTLTSHGGGASCINAFDQVTVYFSSPIQIQFSNSTVLCYGTSTEVNAGISGGNPPYNLLWSNGSTQSHIHAMQGNYVLSVTDNLGCFKQNAVQVNSPPEISMNSIVTPISCHGYSTGAIDVTISGGVSPYQFQWSTGSVHEDLSMLSAGDYILNIIDHNGCLFSDTISVTQTDPISLTVHSVKISCHGFSDGVLAADVYGGQSPYTINWSNGMTGSLLEGLSAGTYFVSVVDANGCSFNDSLPISLSEPPILNFTEIALECPLPGSGLSQLNFNISGGWSNHYQVSLDSGLTFAPIGQNSFFLPTDSIYLLLIRDSFGCMSEIPEVVFVYPELKIDKVIAPVCFYAGDSLAEVSISASGGHLGNYLFSINNVIQASSSGWLTAQLPAGGTFEVEVNDSLGCISAPFQFSLNSQFVVNSNVSSFNGFAVDCHGMGTGAIDLNPTGGVAPYQFSWSNNSVSEDITGVTAGTYSVIVHDQNFCKDTLVFQLISPQPIALDTFILSDYHSYEVSCNGLQNGQINISFSGGVGSYTYQWNNGSTNEDLINVSSGSYVVWVTDSNNCKQEFSFQLNQPDPLEVSVLSLSNYNGYNVRCNHSQDGEINLFASGGSGSISYFYNNVSSASYLDSLSAGVYTFYVFDQNGCTDSIEVILNEPPALFFSNQNTSNYNGYQVSCNGFYNGEIDLETVGGVGQSYQYYWSNGINTEDQYGLSAGNYQVTVQDSNGCTLSQSFTLNEPDSILIFGGISTNYNGFAISCHGSSDGAIDITAAGGVGSYSFLWSNGIPLEDVDSIPAGNYNVLITDANNCTASATYLLNSPDSISVQENIQHILCNGFHDGSVSLVVNGGVPPMLYSWSDGSSSDQVHNLSVGQVSVNLTDQNNCMTSKSFIISESNPILIEGELNHISCYGYHDGQINLEVNGGLPQYFYTWSNGMNTSNLMQLNAGVYTVTVTDQNNCSASDTFYLTEPDSLTINLIPFTHANGHYLSSPFSHDGQITCIAGGGTLPYNFLWSNGSITQNQNNLSSGIYHLEIMDDHGCKKSSTITIDAPSILDMPTGISPNGDGKNDRFVVRGLESYPLNSIYIYNRWGNLVFNRENYLNDWSGTNDSGETLPDGTYFVILEIHSPDLQLHGYVDVRK